MERVGGIEPPSSGWKPEIIATIRYPLYFINFILSKIYFLSIVIDKQA